MQIPIPEANFFRHPKRLFHGLLVAVFTITGVYSQPRPDDSEKIKPLFVMISAYYTEAQIENIGAGLIFGATHNRLYIATAEHVVRPRVDRRIVEAGSIMVQFRSLPGEKFKAVLQSDSDKILDLAVLRIEDWEAKGIDAGRVPFDRLGKPGKLKRGADVFHVGNPMGLSWHTNVKPDKISENMGNFLSFESNFITTGHSGGGLFNECWDLVGMIIEDQPPDGKATRIDKIVETLQQWGYPISLRESPARFRKERCEEIDGPRPVAHWGIRVGMAHNDDKAFYVDVENSLYTELYLDYFLWGSNTFYITFQPTIGLNIVRHFGFMRGVKVPNGFLSLKGEISGWEQYNIPIRIGIGAGIGGQGINFTYEPGDDGFVGNKRTTKTKSHVPASTFFIEVNFAISDAINLQGLFRRFSKSEPFEIPLEFSNPEFGIGSIGGYCIVAGMEFDLNLSGINYFMDF